MDSALLEGKLTALGTLGANPACLDLWREFITNAPADQLRRINAFELAARWHTDFRQVLTQLIHAATVGLMELSWDLVCPACSFVNSHDHLETVRANQLCGGCGQSFLVMLDRSVEVTFSLNQSIRPLAHPTGSTIGHRETRVVTGLDCVTLPAFREFFDTHILFQTESLHVNNVAILFTDIKGSTQLYERFGDARGYLAVHKHFEVLFKTVAANEGALIKTIGDAVMASFAHPVQAVRAALAAQETFIEFRPLLPDDQEAIVVKMGIHHGPSLAVTLNDQIDFFGRTVNIAARTQQQASGGELLLTEDTYNDSSVKALLSRKGLVALALQTKLKGLSETFVLYKIVCANDASHAPGLAQ